MFVRISFKSSTMCQRGKLKCGRWRTLIFFVYFICVISEISGDSNQVLNHRHRLRHGDDHARARSRRNGRETPSVYVVDRAEMRVADTVYRTDSHSAVHQNLHKPDFSECGNYRPELQENQPEGTEVIKVEATDKDPKDSGGTITYSIVVSGEQAVEAFSVDPVSGALRTIKTFDRDEPAREKEVYVTVRATDNGTPQLDAVCTIKVKITDINDNKPMFDKYEYRESIPQDHGVRDIVMRISATDIDDGNNGAILYSLQSNPNYPGDIEYFDIVPENGEVRLLKPLDANRDRVYHLQAVATDKGIPPQSNTMNLEITVAEPNKKAPVFNNNFPTHMRLLETFNEKTPIFTIGATSNGDDDELIFELLTGQTEPTNKEKVFYLQQFKNATAVILLDKQLNFERVPNYTLTVRASNKFLASEAVLTVEVVDENDESPKFQEIFSGSVLEDEDIGTPVMRVRSYDLDGTFPNNDVTLSLDPDAEENFRIDPRTGDITTRKRFDREKKETYLVTVIARDGAPSALTKDGLPNERSKTFKIEIADKNDNPPKFDKLLYEADIEEDANLLAKVIEVKARDNDTASIITYSIANSTDGDAFDVEHRSSGKIIIKNGLDYERKQKYTLKVIASDSVFQAETTVVINVINVNDNPPKFVPNIKTNVTIDEGSPIPTHCIFTVEATDPDRDPEVPQQIEYFIERGKEHFSMEGNGCVKVTNPLDRDRPDGFPWQQVRVGARDSPIQDKDKTLVSFLDLTVTLNDINDNKPFLNCTNPVVWEENRPAGFIIQLTADDYDSIDNGPPFSFSIVEPSEIIRTSFYIQGSKLYASKDNFDREERKQYTIPIAITDSGLPSLTGTSTLTVIIGDENDNMMKEGESKIFVYKYKQNSTFSIGRVYVEDPDDWDLPYKTFSWESSKAHPQFNLDPDSGDIIMKPTTTSGDYVLRFSVYDMKFLNTVTAVVNVTVKEIPEEAVYQSGSIRFMTTKEQFIIPDSTGKSKRDRLRTEIAKTFNIPDEKIENVDVFTVVNTTDSTIDVRYSVHGSPYYKPEKLDGIMGQRKDALEQALQLNIVMVRVDECLSEKQPCETSCTNTLVPYNVPYKIYTNTSTFVGINAIVEPKCVCAGTASPASCQPNPCLNNGICHSGGGRQGFTCECVNGFYGPRCQDTSVSFVGNGYAWYPPLTVCEDSSLDMHITTYEKNGLILYNGPVYTSPFPYNTSDFISFELRNGKPVLLLDYGSGTTRIELTESDLADGKSHKISLRWSPNKISMLVDDCNRQDPTCYNSSSPTGTNAVLNVNGPLQLGGLSFRPNDFRHALRWSFVPTDLRFDGCVANLTFNGEYYNLGEPSYSMGNVTSCDAPRVLQVSSLGVGLHFIIILIVCILILLLLIIAIVFYRKRRNYEEVGKGDPHDDVRENIINYSDEGGGEGDQTGYDLSVLTIPTTNGPYIKSPDKIPMENMGHHGRMPDSGEGPDIQSFLQGNKNKVDNDPDGLPYDDVRNYAYEGDGNSMGSLSSLASGTDDGDLNFDYLPTFGPRFKKLADMYGGHSSDDESYTGAPPEAWC